LCQSCIDVITSHSAVADTAQRHHHMHLVTQVHTACICEMSTVC